MRTGMVAFIALLITLIVAVILYFYNREIGLFMLGAATSALVDLARITLKTTIQEFMSNRKARERMKRTIRDDYTRLLIIIQNPNLRSRIELVDRLDDLQYLLDGTTQQLFYAFYSWHVLASYVHEYFFILASLIPQGFSHGLPETEYLLF